MSCNLAAFAHKTNDELRYIMKDAREAADAVRNHDVAAECKYLDQVNDAATILYRRERAAALRAS
jgi:ribosomal protein L22